MEYLYSVLFTIHGYQVCLIQEDGMALMVIETYLTERLALIRASDLTHKSAKA